METDHIVPKAEGGTDDIDNAIAVCFECHAEIHSYNDRHPRGRKFRPEELRLHKDQWLAICRDKPEALTTGSRDIDVGPLQALVDELEYNRVVAENAKSAIFGSPFRDEQIGRAIRAGAIASLKESIRDPLLQVYVSMRDVNQVILANQFDTMSRGLRSQHVKDAMVSMTRQIGTVRENLVSFLASDERKGA